MSRVTQIVIGPNASLSVRQAWGFMALTASTGLGIAMVMALQGFWPILPFAGIELTALGAALAVSVRRNAYREVIRFDGDDISVEFGVVGRGVGGSVRLQRAWTRVWLDAGAHRHAPTELRLSSSGQRVQIARCLTDAERERLYRRLQELLTPAWRHTPGAQAQMPAPELPLGE